MQIAICWHALYTKIQMKTTGQLKTLMVFCVKRVVKQQMKACQWKIGYQLSELATSLTLRDREKNEDECQ